MLSFPGRGTAAALLLAAILPAGALARSKADKRPPPPRVSGKWLRVETPHFEVITDATGRRARSLAVSLEKLRVVLAQVAGRPDINSPLPTFIFLFKNEGSFKRFRGNTGEADHILEGFFVPHRDANYVALNAAPRSSRMDLTYHEFLHIFLNDNYPGAPLWFDEGLAEYYSTFWTTQAYVEVGRPVREHVSWLARNDLIPLRQLFTMDPASPEYNEGVKRGVFYAQSWALVHYLLRGNPERAGQVQVFLALLGQGVLLDDAFSRAFGGGYAEMEKELRAYVTAGSFPFARMIMPEVVHKLEADMTPMGEADVLHRLGDFLSHTAPSRAADATNMFRRALELQPGHGGARGGLGYLHYLAGDHAAAEADFAAAARLEPQAYLWPFLQAQSTLARTVGATAGGESDGAAMAPLLSTARGLFRRSIELNPDVASAYAGLGVTYIHERAGLEEGIAALGRALAMLPSRPDIAYNLAVLHLNAGNRQQAETIMKTVLAAAGDQRWLAAASDALLQADLEQAESLFKGQHLEEGVALLLEIIPRVTDAGLREHLAGQAQEAQAVLAHNRNVRLLRQAREAVERGAQAEARTLLRQILEHSGDPSMRRQAEVMMAGLPGGEPGSGP